MTWIERAADRSQAVQQTRTRSVERVTLIVSAARRLVELKGASFTTQELVKEAGVALQTFYRYFPGKDQLLLAVIADIIEESCEAYEAGAADIEDPVERLHSYVIAISGSLKRGTTVPSFITTEHWRLQQLYPDELAQATKPVTELLLRDIRAATAAGRLEPASPEFDAWLIVQIMIAVYHYFAASPTDAPPEQIGEKVWAFCLGALGGRLRSPDSTP